MNSAEKEEQMKRYGLITVTTLTMVLLLGATWASALEPIPQESGFSGFIRPGVGYINFKSNMVASFLGYDLTDKRTNSLFDSPDSQSNAIALIPFSLEYTFAGTRTQLFLGTDLIDLIRFDLSQQFGVKQGIGSLGILQGGILFSGIPAKVWRDPYIVNQNRKETKRKSTGGRLTWDRIFGSGFQLQYTYRQVDIDNEKSGEFLGLTSEERKLLERDGDRHAGEILYRFRPAKGHVLAPAFVYRNNDIDGKAMRNDAYDIQLTYGYFGDPFSVTLNGWIGQADYDKKNPIYNKKQEDDRYGIQGALYYANPWGWRIGSSKPMDFYIGGGYGKTDANISFYDQEVFLTTVGVFFKW